MPLFYFDTHDDKRSMHDEIGMDLPDLAAARLEALKMLPDVAREVLPDDGDRRDIICDIRNEAGHLVFTSHLSFFAREIQRPAAD